MENIKHVALIIRRKEDLWEGSRSMLGLTIENFHTYMFVLDAEVEMTEEYKKNLEWLEEMECKWPFFSPYHGRTRFPPLQGISLHMSRIQCIFPHQHNGHV